MRGRANLILINGVVVLILIILEVLYERLKINITAAKARNVLILIILEVLYEPLGIRAISLLGLVS